MAYPYLTYCNVVWSINYTEYIRKLNVNQKKIIRIISMASYNAPTAPLYKELQILKIADITKLCILKIMYKSYHRTNTGLYRLDLFIANARHPELFFIPSIRLNTTKFSLSYQGPIHWNPTNCEMKKLPTIHSFKRNITHSILNSY